LTEKDNTILKACLRIYRQSSQPNKGGCEAHSEKTLSIINQQPSEAAYPPPLESAPSVMAGIVMKPVIKS
jgi:hypothetical protein